MLALAKGKLFHGSSHASAVETAIKVSATCFIIPADYAKRIGVVASQLKEHLTELESVASRYYRALAVALLSTISRNMRALDPL